MEHYHPKIDDHIKALKPNGDALRFKVADFEGEEGGTIVLERTDKDKYEKASDSVRIELSKLRQGINQGRVFVYEDPLEQLYIENGEIT